VNRTGGQERRKSKRYPLAFPVSYRVTPRNAPALAGRGTTYDVSLAGVSFACRQPLPVGAHIEVIAQWPACGDGGRPLELKMTGFVVRSDHAGAAVRVMSHKLCATRAAVLQYAASA